jgi:hypothetical protein
MDCRVEPGNDEEERHRTAELLRQLAEFSQFLARAATSSTLISSLAATWSDL